MQRMVLTPSPVPVRRLLLVWVLAAIPCGLAEAQVSAPSTRAIPVDAEGAGFDSSALEALDALFEREVEQGRVVGCVALAARGDHVGYCRTFGLRDREAEEPMTEDTIFRIYSMSKPVTSVAVLMLVERGSIQLDDPVEKHLPALAEQRVLAEVDGEMVEVAAERSMTVRDLLRHTSGLTYGFFGNTPVDQAYRKAGILSRQDDLEALVEELAEIPLLHQPGTRYHYSVSTDVLGRLVEVVSGQDFAAFLEENIFEPLGMVDTFFTVPRERQERLAQLYRPVEGGGLAPARAMTSWRFVNPNRFYSGGGGLCSTIGDYLRFARMLLGKGELDGTRILEEETVAAMTSDQLGEIRGRRGGFRFGLGVSIDDRGRYGWGGAAGTRFWIDPREGMIGLFMVQIYPYRAPNYERQMKDILYD